MIAPWNATHAEKMRVWSLMSGISEEIGRPSACAACRATDRRLVWHHPDYGRPRFVVGVCDSCHRLIHTGAIVEPVTLRTYPPAPTRTRPRTMAGALLHDWLLATRSSVRGAAASLGVAPNTVTNWLGGGRPSTPQASRALDMLNASEVERRAVWSERMGVDPSDVPRVVGA